MPRKAETKPPVSTAEVAVALRFLFTLSMAANLNWYIVAIVIPNVRLVVFFLLFM
jgi:hypothetical protein